MTNSKLGIIAGFMALMLAFCAGFAPASGARGEVLASSFASPFASPFKAQTTIKTGLKTRAAQSLPWRSYYIAPPAPPAFANAQTQALASHIKPYPQDCPCPHNKRKYCSFGFALAATGGSYLAAYTENCSLLPPRQNILPGRLAEVALPPPKERS